MCAANFDSFVKRGNDVNNFICEIIFNIVFHGFFLPPRFADRTAVVGLFSRDNHALVYCFCRVCYCQTGIDSFN